MYNLKFFAAAFVAACISLPANATNPQSGTVNEAKTEKAQPSGWFYGAFANMSSSPYRGMANEIQALPIIGYRSNKLSWMGPRVSYQLFEQEGFEASTLLDYYMVGFDDGDSDFFTGMSERRNSFFAGFSASYTTTNKLSLSLSSMQDLQGRSDGNDTKLGLSYAHNVGPIFITPKVELTRLSRAYTDYYYGVRSAEENSERKAYDGSTSLNKSVGLSVGTPIFLGGFSRIAVSHHWLDSAITDSPLIDDDHYWQATLTFSRFFSTH